MWFPGGLVYLTLVQQVMGADLSSCRAQSGLSRLLPECLVKRNLALYYVRSIPSPLLYFLLFQLILSCRAWIGSTQVRLIVK